MARFNRLTVPTCVLLIALSGCIQQVAKQPTPFAGSKSDGTVTLAFEYGRLEQPVVDWQQAGVVAKDRCEAWGYKGAESFGVPQSQCIIINGYGDCMRWRITNMYQCVDKIRKPKKTKKSS